MILINK